MNCINGKYWVWFLPELYWYHDASVCNLRTLPHTGWAAERPTGASMRHAGLLVNVIFVGTVSTVFGSVADHRVYDAAGVIALKIILTKTRSIHSSRWPCGWHIDMREFGVIRAVLMTNPNRTDTTNVVELATSSYIESSTKHMRDSNTASETDLLSHVCLSS